MRSPANHSAIHLSQLGNGMPGLTRACGMSLAESAAVCLEDRTHVTGVMLRLEGMRPDDIALQWDSVDDQQRRTYGDLQEATERGAYGVAILVVKEVTGKVVIERSWKGPGFDYWIGDDDDEDVLPFQGRARLEVSGILSGDDSNVRSRIRAKMGQIEPSDHLAPGYVAIIEFGRPAAHIESKPVGAK